MTWFKKDSRISFQTGGVAMITAGALVLIAASAKGLLAGTFPGNKPAFWLFLALALIIGGVAKLPQLFAVWMRWLCGATAVALWAVALYLAIHRI